MNYALTTAPVKLYSVHEIADLRRWQPDLKHVSLSFYRTKIDLNDYLKAICDEFTLESLEIICGSAFVTELPASLWTPQLRELRIVQQGAYHKKLNLRVPDDFENHLEMLVIDVPYLGIVERLFDTPTLKTIRLGDASGQEYLHKALNLNHLEIAYFDKTKNQTWYDLPVKNLYLRHCQNLPPFQRLPQLKILNAEGYFWELENDWDTLQELEILSLKSYSRWYDKVTNSLSFKRLRSLKTLIIQDTNFTMEDSHWGELPALESLEAHTWRSAMLPEAFFKSSVLKQIVIKDCKELTSLPTCLLESKSLESLQIVNCPQLALSRYWAVSTLQTFGYSGLRLTTEQKKHWETHLMHFLNEIQANRLERLALGCVLIEGLEMVQSTDLLSIKQGLLSLARVKNLFLKTFLLENVYFFNPEQQQQSFPNKPQSIHLLGSTHKAKLDYKSKLIELGYTYHTNLQPDTNLIVIAGHGKIPDRFWEYPHLFFKEGDLELHLETVKPDFLQDSEAPDWRNLQQMIWGGNPDTDGLVFALVKAGGIPPRLIPDLVMMTKMTEVPENVRAGLRKLLKAKGDDAMLKILSASGTPTTHKSYDLFVYYRKKSSEFDYLQMSVCYDMRMKKRITHFFRFMESENHPHRQEIFELLCNQLGDHDFKKMDFKNRWFTPAELTHLLSDARAAGHLESLRAGCFSKEFPEILFKHTALTNLHFRSYATEIPVAIGQLTELTDLILHISGVTTLPISILNLQKLNNLDIAHYSFSAFGSRYHGTPQLTLSN
jgi:hypothetical protein